MRSLMLIALTTVIACETTEEETTENTEDTSSETENARQAPTDLEAITDGPDLAGGLPKNINDLTYFENFDRYEDERDWTTAPMVKGMYDAVIEEVHLKQCSALKPGDDFQARVSFSPDGSAVMNGGLLEANQDTLRYNRVKEAPYGEDEDCIAVEITKGNGTIDTRMAMAMDFHITMELVGETCPEVDPCVDAYSAYLEHELIDLENPTGPGTDFDFEPNLDDLLQP